MPSTVTTRVKGILTNSTEIELSLLGVQERVELLVAVAEIGHGQIPPCCLEIAQQCGRLPLCLHIVGKMISRWGPGWESSILSVLRSDLRSLAEQGGEGSATLTMQERVVSSGLTA